MSQASGFTDSEFEYDGRLIFNGLYHTPVKSHLQESTDPETIRDELRDDLPQFSRGTPQSPSKGYRDLDLEQYVENSELFAEGDTLADLPEQIIDHQFVREKFEGKAEVVDENGNAQTGFVRNPYQTYMYWFYPDYLFLQGSKKDVENTGPEINSQLDAFRFKPLRLHFDFLLWLLYQDWEQNSLPNSLSILRWTDAKAEGDKDAFGEVNEVKGSIDLLRSTSFIDAILQQKRPSMVEGVFSVASNEIRVRLYDGGEIGPKNTTGGKVQIMAQEDIEETPDLHRVLVALDFLSDLGELYVHWQQLDNDEKYVPPTFFEDLRDQADGEGVDITYSRQGLVEEYLDKRDEDWSDYPSL